MHASIPAVTLEKFTTFGDLLRFLRRRAGITQMELAGAVGYSDAQISRLEQNLRLPDIPTIEARFIPALGLEDEPQAVTRLLELAANVRREDAPGLGLCPYKGLNYFDETDADLFVGREALTARLVERVLSLNSVSHPPAMRFLAVVGASGSGKSSLVRAGLVPSLRWHKVSADWDIHVLTPAAHPLESLSISLTQENGSLAAAARLMDDLSQEVRTLHLFANRELSSRNGSRMLIVLDQFEETFALCRSENERSAFIGNLLAAASEPDGPVMVVITLRADFYASCAGYYQLREALALQQEYIGAMTGSELLRAIEEPARRGRWEFEPGLVELLLHDVGHEPGALPLLSHALLETWHRRRGRLLTLSGYASSGGVRGAIAETAEAVFADQFTQEQRAIARRIFLRLTELGDETAAGDTRRRATFNELILKPEESAITRNVLKALADARLIITSEDSAEVAHEALIREWPTLRNWLEDNREGLRIQRHLTESAQEWYALNRETDLLYRGARLAQVLEWAAAHPDELNTLEREFIAGSQTLAEHEARQKEARRQSELEAARKLAEVERRRAEDQSAAARQLQKRSLYLAGAFLLAVVMALTAGILGLQARAASRLATSRELAAASISNLDIDPERSILLALEALSAAYSLEAEDALHQSLVASQTRLTIHAHEAGAAVSVAYSPDGSRLATASADENVRVWDSTSGELLFNTTGHSAAFSPDGKRLATVLSGGTVGLWEAGTGREILLPGPIDAGEQVSFSPDGLRLASVTPVNLPRIWDLHTAKEVNQFPGHTDYVSFVFFSPDGKRLLTTSDDGTARLWDTTTGKELFSLAGHPGWVWTAAFSPDGDLVATVSENEVALWNAATGAKVSTLVENEGTLYAVAFSPDGAQLATGGLDHRINVWDPVAGTKLMTLYGHSGAVFSLAFAPDRKQLASGSDDGTVRVWDLTPGREYFTFKTPPGVSSPIALSPDGASLVGIQAGVLKIWQTNNGAELSVMSGKVGALRAFAFSPDKTLLVAAGADGKVSVWNTATGERLGDFLAHTSLINAIHFDPSGRRFATASDDYKVKLWDVSKLAEPSPVLAIDLPAEVKAIAFSQDGQKLAAGLHNGAIKIWDLAGGKELVTLRGHVDSVTSIAFGLNGQSIAASSLDGTAKIWDAASGKESVTLRGHTNSVTAVAFNIDGTQLATASQDGSAKLWDAGTGQELLTFLGDGSGLEEIRFIDGGSHLVTGGRSGVYAYNLKIKELVALAQTRLTRQLTDEECQKYLHKVTKSCAASSAALTVTPLPPAALGRICEVTNTGGLHDNYFNALIYKGLVESAAQNGWETSVLQSASMTGFANNLQFFTEADCKLIISPGNFLDAIQNAAEVNPQQKFMTMDFAPNPPLENVWTQLYAVDQAAFLAGYAAGAVSRTGKVGVFGGIDIPQVTDFMDGFALGVDYYNKKNAASVEVLGWDVEKHTGLFVGSFCCTTEGRQMAQQLLDNGADVILPVAGKSVGWGAGAEVKEHGNAWIVGVDTDWSVTNPEFSDIILTSIEKRFDVSVVQAARAVADNTFTGGIHTGGLQTGEVGISPFSPSLPLPAGVKSDLMEIRTGIIALKIKTLP